MLRVENGRFPFNEAELQFNRSNLARIGYQQLRFNTAGRIVDLEEKGLHWWSEKLLKYSARHYILQKELGEGGYILAIRTRFKRRTVGQLTAADIRTIRPAYYHEVVSAST